MTSDTDNPVPRALLAVLQDGLTESMSGAERERFLAGRDDWRDGDWQDHCGDPGCGYCCGEIPEGRSRRVA
jgi:hypothetical protein